MSRNLLLIFVKNARIGRVKTRLAKTIGDEKALEIYVKLLQHTSDVTVAVNADKAVFYTEYLEESDEFPIAEFSKYLQFGEDLGIRMKNAFVKGFANAYDKVVIIGSDCKDITTEIIEQAFERLNSCDVVFGPAEDGGYYLMGMKRLHSSLFYNKEWSTSNVLIDSLLDCRKGNLNYELLPVLSDIDEEKDLGDWKHLVE